MQDTAAKFYDKKSTPSNLEHLQLEGLLFALRGNGFVVTPDKAVQAAYVATTIGSEQSFGELKYLLRAIFVTNPQEQAEFDAIFDDYFKKIGGVFGAENVKDGKIKSIASPPAEPKKTNWANMFKGIIVLGALMFVALGIFADDTFLLFLGIIYALVAGFLMAGWWGKLTKWLEKIGNPFQKKAPKTFSPPFTFDLEIPLPDMELVSKGEASNFTRALNRHQSDYLDTEKVDIAQTLRRTIRNGGFIEVAFQPAGVRPGYLLLIDRHDSHEHQNQWFDYLQGVLRSDGATIERYFFDFDPRTCTGERGERLPVQSLFAGQRLLMLSRGDVMVDERYAHQHQWADQLFSLWEEKALLTPKPLRDWSFVENALADDFLIAPSSVDGLLETVNAFDTDKDLNPEDWLVHFDADMLHTDSESIIRSRVPAPLFRWICACAVYPKIRWSLTLYLGRLLEKYPGELLNRENITLINGLKWFREENIPHEIRRALVRELPRDVELKVRRALLALFARQQNLPPFDSYARQEYNLVLWRNAYEVSERDLERMQLNGQLRQTLADFQTDDLELLDFMERLPSSTELIFSSFGESVGLLSRQVFGSFFGSSKTFRNWLEPLLSKDDVLLNSLPLQARFPFGIGERNGSFSAFQLPDFFESNLSIASGSNAENWASTLPPSQSPAAFAGRKLKKEYRELLLEKLRLLGLPERLLSDVQQYFDAIYFEFKTEEKKVDWGGVLAKGSEWTELMLQTGLNDFYALSLFKSLRGVKIDFSFAPGWIFGTPDVVAKGVTKFTVENKVVIFETERQVPIGLSAQKLTFIGEADRSRVGERLKADPLDLNWIELAPIITEPTSGSEPPPNAEPAAQSSAYDTPAQSAEKQGFTKEGLNEILAIFARGETEQAIRRAMLLSDDIAFSHVIDYWGEISRDLLNFKVLDDKAFDSILYSRRSLNDEFLARLQISKLFPTIKEDIPLSTLKSRLESQESVLTRLASSTLFPRLIELFDVYIYDAEEQVFEIRLLENLWNETKREEAENRWRNAEKALGDFRTDTRKRLLELVRAELKKLEEAEQMMQQQTQSAAPPQSEEPSETAGYEPVSSSPQFDEWKNQLRGLISQSEIDSVLDELSVKVNSPSEKGIIKIIAEYNTLLAKNNRRTTSQEEYERSVNQINAELLRLVNSLKGEDVNLNNKKSLSQRFENWKNQLKTFITEAQTERVFEDLNSKLNTTSTKRNDLVLLRGQFNMIVSENTKGVVLPEQNRLTVDRINFSLLNLIDSLRPEDVNLDENKAEAQQRLIIRITGKVQGVFFRESARRKADELGLKGFVRNETDGNVYAEVEGDAAAVKAFVDWCWQGPPSAKVENVTVTPAQLVGFQQFEVRR